MELAITRSDSMLEMLLHYDARVDVRTFRITICYMQPLLKGQLMACACCSNPHRRLDVSPLPSLMASHQLKWLWRSTISGVLMCCGGIIRSGRGTNSRLYRQYIHVQSLSSTNGAGKSLGIRVRHTCLQKRLPRHTR